MSEITHAYLGGLVTKRGDDGFLYINGLVSNDALDLDQQRCDPNWLNEAIPKWFKSAGNVRVMHQPVIGGKAKSIEQSGTGWNANIKVTNKQADIDIEEGAITGLSVGIKNARVEKSLTAPNGLICGGDIIEVSLVDRPANPDCVLEIAKSVGNEWTFKGVEVSDTDQLDLVVSDPSAPGQDVSDQYLPCAACAGTGMTSEVPGEVCARCNGSKVEPKDSLEANIAATSGSTTPNAPENIERQKAAAVCKTCDGKGTIMDGNRDCPDCDGPSKSAEIDQISDADLETFKNVLESLTAKRQFSDKERKHLASTGAAMKNGGFPIKTVEDLKNAIHAIGRAKDRPATIAHIKSRAKALGQTSLIPDDWKTAQGLVQVLYGDVQKGATPDEWMHDPTELQAIALGLADCVKAEIDEMVNGEDEMWDIQTLLSATDSFYTWWNHEASEGETTPPFNSGDDDMSNAYVSLGVSPDLIKSATSDDATDEIKIELRSEIRKALGVDEEIATYKALVTEMQETVKTVKAELEEVQEMAAPGGPVLRQTSDQRRSSAAHDTISTKAAEIRARAVAFTGESSIKQALFAEAEKLESALSSL